MLFSFFGVACTFPSKLSLQKRDHYAVVPFSSLSFLSCRVILCLIIRSLLFILSSCWSLSFMVVFSPAKDLIQSLFSFSSNCRISYPIPANSVSRRRISMLRFSMSDFTSSEDSFLISSISCDCFSTNCFRLSICLAAALDVEREDRMAITMEMTDSTIVMKVNINGAMIVKISLYSMKIYLLIIVWLKKIKKPLRLATTFLIHFDEFIPHPSFPLHAGNSCISLHCQEH